MSEIFHKSCYTSRSTGYKYRTLSTNTGEKQLYNNKEDVTCERKFQELKKEINSRITKEVDESQKARKCILEKFETIDKVINGMLEVQNMISNLRKDLCNAENILVNTLEKVEKIENVIGNSESCSIQSRKSSFCKPRRIDL